MWRQLTRLIRYSLLLLAAPVFAQSANPACDALFADVLTRAIESCGSVPTGYACMGSSPVTAGLRGHEIPFRPRDTLALADVEKLQTGAARLDNGTWGMSLIQADAGLPAGNTVSMVLFGDAQVRSMIDTPTLDLPTIMVENIATYDVNLREGPGTDFNTAGVFPQATRLPADGISADGTWFRVQRNEGGVAWVSQSLISVEGDTSMLTMLEGTYTAPMQSFILESAAGDGDLCGVSASGLLIDLASRDNARLIVNGVELIFNQASLLLQANATDGLLLHVISGNATINAGAFTVDAGTGESVIVPLDESTLIAAGAPRLQFEYDFVRMGGAPLQLLQQNDLQCVTGAAPDDSITAYAGPAETFTSTGTLETAGHYVVTGQTTDGSGQTWLRLSNGGWVAQNSVRTAGLCSRVRQIEVNIPAPLPDPEATAESLQRPDVADTAAADSVPETPLNTPGSFTPASRTIYRANSGPDIMSGTCNGSPTAVCEHLTAITPRPDGSIEWRGQEPEPYILLPTGLNSYAYAGRNVNGNANIDLALTMTGPDTWEMTMTTVFDDDPACTHTFYYTAQVRQ